MPHINKNTALCRILEGDAFFTLTKRQHIAKMPVKDLKDYLWNAFLSSDSRDVHRVIDLAINALESKNPIDNQASIQELRRIKQSFMNGGSIITQHPNFYSQRQMHNTYGQQYPDSISQQIGFSEKKRKSLSDHFSKCGRSKYELGCYSQAISGMLEIS